MLTAEDWVGHAFSLAAAAIGGVIALWLLALDPRSRLNRSLALLLVFRAMFVALFVFSALPEDFLGRLRIYVLVALPFMTAYFAHVLYTTYRPESRLGAAPWRTAVPLALLGAALTFEFLYFDDHDVFFATPAPFELFFQLDEIVNALLALVFIILSRGATLRPVRQAWLIAALGFAIEPSVTATMPLTYMTLQFLNEGQFVVYEGYMGWLYPAAAFVAFAILASLPIVAWRLHRSQPGSVGLRNFALTIGGFTLLGVGVGLNLYFRPFVYWVILHTSMIGFVRLLVPLFLATALVRAQVINLDFRLKITVKRGTIAMMAVALCFAVAEMAANLVGNTVSGVAGGVAAGGVLFLLHPVQRFAERVANRTVPGAKPLGSMDRREKTELYREQATVAWMDGRLQRKERLLLDRLRDRLGLGIAEAAMIESDALHLVPKRRGGRALSL